MKPDNYHVLFYYRVLALMKGYVNSDSTPLQDEYEGEGEPTFTIAYTSRRSVWQNFRHNFQRDKFLDNRDQLIVGVKNGDGLRNQGVVILRKSRHTKVVTLYTKNIHALFNDGAVAEQELHNLLGKFYTVNVEDHSPDEYADFGTTRQSDNEVQVNASIRV